MENCRVIFSSGKARLHVLSKVERLKLFSPWDFQSDKRGDIIWRYKKNQAGWLRRNGYLKI